MIGLWLYDSEQMHDAPYCGHGYIRLRCVGGGGGYCYENWNTHTNGFINVKHTEECLQVCGYISMLFSAILTKANNCHNF